MGSAFCPWVRGQYGGGWVGHGRRRQTYPEVLVLCGLPFLGHGLGRAAGAEADEDEDDGGGDHGVGGQLEDLPLLRGVGHGARAVGTKGDPVRWAKDASVKGLTCGR